MQAKKKHDLKFETKKNWFDQSNQTSMMMMMMMKTRGINWNKITTLPEEEGNSLSFFF